MKACSPYVKGNPPSLAQNVGNSWNGYLGTTARLEKTVTAAAGFGSLLLDKTFSLLEKTPASAE
jgi:hypothetical protein